MIVEQSKLAVTDSTEVGFPVIVAVFFVKAQLAQQGALLHLPLPPWLVAVSHDLFAAHCANVRSLFLLEHELPCLLYVAVAAEQAFDAPVFTGLVLVAPELLAAYRTIHDLLFAKNVQVRKYLPVQVQKRISALLFVGS